MASYYKPRVECFLTSNWVSVCTHVHVCIHGWKYAQKNGEKMKWKPQILRFQPQVFLFAMWCWCLSYSKGLCEPRPRRQEVTFRLQNAANVITSRSRKCNNVTVISIIITICQYYDLITHTDTDWSGLSWTAMQNSETCISSVFKNARMLPSLGWAGPSPDVAPQMTRLYCVNGHLTEMWLAAGEQGSDTPQRSYGELKLFINPENTGTP